jgi:RNA polymerase sigma factor (sigma-70 family)
VAAQGRDGLVGEAAMSAVGDARVLLERAANGDELAWSELVARHTPRIRRVAQQHRLPHAYQDDVVQRTWLALFQHIGEICEPAALGGWLATTARNESIRVLNASRRVIPVETVEAPQAGATEPTCDELVAAVELRVVLRAAIERISGRQRALLDLLLHETEPSYEAIGALLRMPVGSIGPTRARTVARLRRDPDLAGLIDGQAQRPRPTRPPRPLDLL